MCAYILKFNNLYFLINKFFFYYYFISINWKKNKWKKKFHGKKNIQQGILCDVDLWEAHFVFKTKIQLQTSSCEWAQNFVLRDLYIYTFYQIFMRWNLKKKSFQIKFYIKCEANKKFCEWTKKGGSKKVVNLLKSREINTGLCI